MGKWSIPLGMLWLAGRVFSPNMVEGTMGLALLIILAVAAAVWL
jgi:hypothetical protein